MDENQLVLDRENLVRAILLRIEHGMHFIIHSITVRYYRTILMLIYGILFLLTTLIVMGTIVFAVPTIQELAFREKVFVTAASENKLSFAKSERESKLQKDIVQLEAKLNKKIPSSTYLVINTSKNKFFLYRNRKLIGEGKCSTGSYILLSDGDRQQWIFKTPRGVFHIHGKTTDPVWIKPDWAFVEEGLPVPPVAHSSRYEYGVLGEYALSLGQGYLIHGTLYQRFLGLPVTHGCIRLSDNDLKLVYNRLSIGSRVFIY